MADIIHERRKFNEEIERAFIQTSLAVEEILMYRQTERGIADIDLYTMFFGNFSYLVILTSDLEQLRSFQTEVKAAIAWIMEKVDIDKNKNIMARCEEGIEVFFAYKKILSEQGVIALPPR
jgi:hypothetical protein